MKTKEKVRDFILQQNMIMEGDRLLIGLSGGADSVCLFYLLLELMEEISFTMTAVHVEHGIRGQEALEDAKYVSRLCKEHKIPCYVEHFSVPQLARKAGMSEEEMGRKLRYEVFERIGDEVGANRIAVAHHKNDIAETMLFHLCRGTGLSGLCPMAPVRGRLIRPLLCLNREEIENYLKERNLSYREDSTNKDMEYSRNYIRREIIPRLQEINPRAVEHFNQTSEMLAEAKEVLEDRAADIIKEYVTQTEQGVCIRQELFLEEREYLVAVVLQNVMGELADSKKDIQSIHIQSLIRLSKQQTGRKVDLPYGMHATKEYEGVLLQKGEKNKGNKIQPQEIELKIPGETRLWDNRLVKTRIFSVEEGKEIPNKAYTKWFDYDIINKSMHIRTRQPGDYMVVDEGGSRKKLKELFINEKVPRTLRETVPLIAQEDRILWAVGVRMGEYGKITPNTKQILEINICGGKNNE